MRATTVMNTQIIIVKINSARNPAKSTTIAKMVTAKAEINAFSTETREKMIA